MVLPIGMADVPISGAVGGLAVAEIPATEDSPTGLLSLKEFFDDPADD